MRISVTVPTYNNVARLERTIAPLLADEAAGEVIVVVDGSRDGSYELLQAMAERHPRLRPFWTENRGCPHARQFALEKARFDVVLMMDDDVVAHPGLVSGHAAWHDDEIPRLVVGYMPTPVPPRRRGSFVVERYGRIYEDACAEYEADPNEVLIHMWAGNVSVPKQKLNEAGGCANTAGIAYMDDVELGLRLARTGVEPVFDRRLRADHEFQRSVSGWFRTSRQVGRDWVALERVHPGVVRIPSWRSSGVGGLLRRFARRPGGYGLITRLGRPALSGAGTLRLWRLENTIAIVLDFIELQQGMLEAIREGPPLERGLTPEFRPAVPA